MKTHAELAAIARAHAEAEGRNDLAGTLATLEPDPVYELLSEPLQVDADRVASRAKPVVSAILRSPLHPLLSFGLMLISFEGRKTGRRYTFPVGYQRSGGTITVLASRARRKSWWRNFREPAPARVLVRGRWLEGTGRALAGDSAEFRAAVEATFRRLPRLAGQFGIAYRRGEALSSEQWRMVAAEGAVVEIVIAAEPGLGR